MKVCNIVGCPTLHAGKGGRCPAHTREAQAARGKRGYNTRGHRSFRSSVLTRDPVCVECSLSQATVADHYPLTRKELIAQGLNPNDPKHGRGLCKPCHDRHTAATTPGGFMAY